MNDSHASQEWEFRRTKQDARGREVRLYRSRANPQKYKRVIVCTGRLRFGKFHVGRFVCVQFATMGNDPAAGVEWRGL